MTGVQLRMYLFVCRAVTKKNDMWNSFNDISRALQLSKNKIVSVIKELVELGFIRKTKVLKKDGSYSDNHYSITKPEESNDTENKELNSAQMTTMAEITGMVFSCVDEIGDSVSERVYLEPFYFYSGVVP